MATLDPDYVPDRFGLCYYDYLVRWLRLRDRYVSPESVDKIARNYLQNERELVTSIVRGAQEAYAASFQRQIARQRAERTLASGRHGYFDPAH